MGIRICPDCGGKVSDQRNECVHCGYSFVKKYKKCPDCEEMMEETLFVCPSCGFDYNFSNEDAIKESSEPILNVNAASSSNAKGDNVVIVSSKPDVVNIKCPNCGNSDATLVSENKYKCNSCNSDFMVTDGRPIIIQNTIKIDSQDIDSSDGTGRKAKHNLSGRVVKGVEYKAIRDKDIFIDDCFRVCDYEHGYNLNSLDVQTRYIDFYYFSGDVEINYSRVIGYNVEINDVKTDIISSWVKDKGIYRGKVNDVAVDTTEVEQSRILKSLSDDWTPDTTEKIDLEITPSEQVIENIYIAAAAKKVRIPEKGDVQKELECDTTFNCDEIHFVRIPFYYLEAEREIDGKKDYIRYYECASTDEFEDVEPETFKSFTAANSLYDTTIDIRYELKERNKKGLIISAILLFLFWGSLEVYSQIGGLITIIISLILGYFSLSGVLRFLVSFFGDKIVHKRNYSDSKDLLRNRNIEMYNLNYPKYKTKYKLTKEELYVLLFNATSGLFFGFFKCTYIKNFKAEYKTDLFGALNSILHVKKYIKPTKSKSSDIDVCLAGDTGSNNTIENKTSDIDVCLASDTDSNNTIENKSSSDEVDYDKEIEAIDNVLKIKKLLDEGSISKEDFEVQKRQLLNLEMDGDLNE